MGKFFRENQVLGRRNAIGCVALEITQRCNLDCTLCYLSESSERVKDIPLEDVFRRLDGILERFGAPTSVQIDASALDAERIHACSFMVMTANGRCPCVRTTPAGRSSS